MPIEITTDDVEVLIVVESPGTDLVTVEVPGIRGLQGDPGATGPTGAGVPVGGATGNLLQKSSSADNDTSWIAATDLVVGSTIVKRSPGGQIEVAVPGSAANPVRSDDTRLTDARTPVTHTHTAAQISDSTTIGRTILTAADGPAVRTAIGAGTSSLVIGTTSTTAKAGDYQPTAANISDSTAVGRSVLTAADAAAARTAIGAGTSSLVIGTTAADAKAGNYQPTAANISDSTTVGRALIVAVDAAAARTAITAANATHTHVATTDLTATGTKDTTTFLRGDNTWAAPTGTTAPDASTTVKGIVQLTGDLAGTATAPTVPGLATKANNSVTISAGAGLTGGGDLSANRSFAVAYGSAASTAVQGNDTRVVADQAASTASIRTIGTGALQASAGNHTHTATGISDSTAVGRAVMTPVDAAAGRTAIGAGTSSLALGTTNTTAKAGDYQPTAANISDSTSIGRTILTAADAAAVRAAISAQTLMSFTATKTATYTVAADEIAVMNVSGGGSTLNLPTSPTAGMRVGFQAIGATTGTPLTINRGGTATIGDAGATTEATPLAGVVRVYQYDLANTRWITVQDFKPLTALDTRFAAATHTHTAAQISDSTAIGRSVLTAADAAAVRTAIGAGTSSLALGTTNTTAKAGDYQPTAANISDSTAIGRSVLTAADAAAVRTAISAVFGNGITEVRLLTQAAYDALGSWSSSTLYVIVG